MEYYDESWNLLNKSTMPISDNDNPDGIYVTVPVEVKFKHNGQYILASDETYTFNIEADSNAECGSIMGASEHPTIPEMIFQIDAEKIPYNEGNGIPSGESATISVKLYDVTGGAHTLLLEDSWTTVVNS